MNIKGFVVAMVACVPTWAAAGPWEVQLGAGLMLSERTSTEAVQHESPFNGTFIEGYAARDFGAVRLAFDGRFEGIDDEGTNDVYHSGPLETGLLGVHVGRRFNGFLLGGYAGVGRFDGYENDDGWTVGVEYERFIGSGSVFAQLGYVDANGASSDNEFKGTNLRIGYQGNWGGKWTGLAAYEFAYSPDCFEDCFPSDQWGRYQALEFGVAYALSQIWDVHALIRLSEITANTEDSATDNSIYLGVRANLGGNRPTSALRTPMGGFHAAGWMGPLD